MDGDTDGGGGEDRRRDFHTLLSMEFFVINGLSPALNEQRQQHRDRKILIRLTHANAHTYTQLGRGVVICCLVLNTPS